MKSQWNDVLIHKKTSERGNNEFNVLLRSVYLMNICMIGKKINETSFPEK